jgi:hypothetical protein
MDKYAYISYVNFIRIMNRYVDKRVNSTQKDCCEEKNLVGRQMAIFRDCTRKVKQTETQLKRVREDIKKRKGNNYCTLMFSCRVVLLMVVSLFKLVT